MEFDPVRIDEPSPARGGQAGDFRLPGGHALLHDHPETLARIGEVLRKRWHHDIWESRKVVRAGLRRLAQLPCRPGVWPVHPCVSTAGCNAGGCGRYAAGPNEPDLVGSDWSALTEILWPRASIRHPWPDPAVCHQSPEVGAGWFNDQVRICGGGALGRDRDRGIRNAAYLVLLTASC